MRGFEVGVRPSDLPRQVTRLLLSDSVHFKEACLNGRGGQG